MKTNSELFCVIFLLNLFLIIDVNASHLAGGEVTYRCLGSNRYHIVFTLYRDCKGIAAPSTLTVSLVSSCGDNISTTAMPIAGTGTLISIPCAGQLTTCNGGTQPGIEKWQYFIDYTLPRQCADWRFSVSLNARNAAITTLQSASTYNFYAEAHLNDTLSLACHHSPFFNSDPDLFKCISQTSVIDCSVTGTDSIVYSLAQPRSDVNTYVPYVAGYSINNFISSSPPPNLNSNTGMLTVRPTAIEVGNYVVVARQYRNGVMIGSVMRDINIYTQSCVNTVHAPQASGINNTTQYGIHIVAGKKSCFKIYSSDSDIALSTDLSWNSGISGASFVTDGAFNESAEFCWTPQLSDVALSPHYFTVKVVSSSCPRGIASYAYSITVVDSGNCSISLPTNATNASCPGATDGMAAVLPASGTPPFTYIWNTGATSSSVTNLSAGYYQVSVTDSAYCVGVAGARIFNTIPFCNFNRVRGICFIDSNQNNIQDAGEPGYNGMMIGSTGSVNSYSSLPNSQGEFLNYILDTGIVTTAVQNIYPRYMTCNPVQHVSNFSSYFNTDTVNFALVPVPGFQDLRISLLPLTPFAIGRNINFRLEYSNVGTKIMSGTVFMIKDPRTGFVSAYPMPDLISGDSLSWAYTNLIPNESRTIGVTLQVPSPPTVNVGDLLTMGALIDPLATDTTPSDNRACVCEKPVVASYDPNDKNMLGDKGLTTSQVVGGEYLTYLIRFQNTGNDTAYQVVVRDTLDNKLDNSSFGMVAASHNYTISIENNRYVKWTFDNILLPDSGVDEPGSHGYFCYRIKPKVTLSPGDLIKNTASIYFDFNAPVVTNTDSVIYCNLIASIISSGSVVLCPGSPLTANDFMSGYLWSNGKTTQTIHVYSSGSYSVTVTDAFGCSSTIAAVVEVDSLSVNFSGLPSKVCANSNSSTLYGSPAGGTFSGAGIFGNTFNPTLAGVGVHVIVYSFTDNFGCTGTYSDTVLVEVCTKTGEINTNFNFSIYPNPVSGEDIVAKYNLLNKPTRMMVFDMYGKELAQYELIPQNTEQHLKLPKLAKGIYIARLINESCAATVKFEMF